MRRGRVIRMAGSIPRPPVLWVLVFHIAACWHAVETEGGWAARSAPGGAPRAHSDDGGLAQLARASALQAEGQRFDPVYLHHQSNIFGVIAQLGERLHGMQEVIGSTPIFSTCPLKGQ